MDRTNANRIALAILILGLGAAAAIYATAEPIPANPLGYDPMTNKKYIRELEVYGGKANVLSAEFMQWFDTLWHGERLAYTVAVITVVTTWGFWWIATVPPLEEESPQGKNPSGPPEPRR